MTGMCTPLAKWMRAQGIEDADLARGIDISVSHANRLKRGLRQPSWEMARKLVAFSRGAVSLEDFAGAPANDQHGETA